MVDDNNGAYQFPVYGDPRGDSWKPDKPRLVVMSMPPTRPGAYTSQLELSGDVKEAERYVPLVTQQMMQMHQQNVNNLEIVTRPVDLGGGSSILCRRKFTEDVATIHVPPKPKALGPLHLNFDPSVQKTFGQSLLDKNNGFPLYFNETSNTSITSKGVVVADGECSGCLYFNPKSTHPTDKTTALVLSAEASGDGSGYLYAYAMGPSTWLDVGFFCSNDRTEVWLPGNESSINTIEQSSQPRILMIRTRSRDIIGDSDGSVGFTSVTDLFLDGKKIDETSENRRSWGTYYGDNQNRIFTTMSSNSGGSITLNQKMLYDAFLSNSQISELTDNLAAKWGL